MQLANILSDLTSLFVCDNRTAAERLVSARPQPSASSSSSKVSRTRSKSKSAIEAGTKSKDEIANAGPDLARAYKLLELHRDVKTAYAEDSADGDGRPSALRELHEARRDVAEVLRRMKSTDHSSVPSSEAQDTSAQDTTAADDEDVSAWA